MSADAHARPTRDAPEPLYDVDVPTPTHAERARTLVAQISTGTLCTLAIEPAGYPYGSFVTTIGAGHSRLDFSCTCPSRSRRRRSWPRYRGCTRLALQSSDTNETTPRPV